MIEFFNLTFKFMLMNIFLNHFKFFSLKCFILSCHYCNVVFEMKKIENAVTGPHEGGSGDDDSKHVCIIAVFLLVRLLYLLIHSLDYLFRLIQTLTMLTDFINLVAVSSSIAYCSLNLFLKSILSH